MTKLEFRERLLLASVAFRDADTAATKENPYAAYENSTKLAYNCAKLAGLPVGDPDWSKMDRCPVLCAIMTIAYCRNDQWAPGVVDSAWRAVKTSVSKQPCSSSRLPTPAEYLQMLSVLVAAEACKPVSVPQVARTGR